MVYMVGDDGTNLKLNVKGDGSFEQKINPDVNYIFLATCKGYLNHKEELTVKPVKTLKSIHCSSRSQISAYQHS